MAYYECTNSTEKTQTISKTLSYIRLSGGHVDFIFNELSEIKGLISSSSKTADSHDNITMGILSFTISKNTVKAYIYNGDSYPRTNTVTITAIGN